MHSPIQEQRVLSFAQAQHSAADIGAMTKAAAIKAREIEELSTRLKECVEYTDLKAAKDDLKALVDAITGAKDDLVVGLANGGK